MSSDEVPAARQPKEHGRGGTSKDTDRDTMRKMRIVKKMSKHPPTAEMVFTSKRCKEASVSAMSKYIKENYDIDMRRIKSHMNKYLTKAVEKGDLDLVRHDRETRRFRIKEKETLVPMREKRRLEKESSSNQPKKRNLNK